MSDAAMRFKDEATGQEFEWHGGEYIEIGYVSHDTGEFVAGDVINVWDYAAGAPRIERSLEAFEARVREYLEDVDDDEGLEDERGVCPVEAHEWVGDDDDPDEADRISYVVTITAPEDAANVNDPEAVCAACAGKLADAYVGYGWSVIARNLDE